MDNLTLDRLKELMQHGGTPKLTMVMVAYRAGPDTRQNPIRFKTLLQEAEQKLIDYGMESKDVIPLLEPAWDIIPNSDFWQHQYGGLAVFTSPGEFHMYRLPYEVEDQVVVGQQYHFTPVLRLFTNNGQFYILAFSQNEVQLFEATRHSIHQLDLPIGTPASIQAALWADQPERELQFHTATAPEGRSAEGGNRDAMFFGTGAGDPGAENKERIQRYLNLLDDGLKPLLRGKQTPLVLAGVEYLQPIYREVSEYAHILPKGVEGNPDRMNPEELHARAWPVVEPVLRQETQGAIEQYQILSATERALSDITEIVQAAYYGRVSSLFVATGRQEWGTFDPNTGKVELRDSDAERTGADMALIDFAVMHTLLNSGAVYAISQEEMPADSSVAALLRY